MRLLLPGACLLGLLLPSSALAHASLAGTNPGFSERLDRTPRRIVLRFDQGVTVLPRAIRVLDTRGRVVSGRARIGQDGRLVSASVPSLRRGAYTVRWRALSNDGHVIAGVYTFGVGVRAPPPTEAFGAEGPTRVEHLVRWAFFLSLALLIGGLAFRLLVLRGPVPRRLERRWLVATGLGVVLTLECGIVAFILRADAALQLPFSGLLYGDLSPFASETRLGIAFTAMTLGYVAVAALLFLAWLTDRIVLLWPAFVLAAGFASGLSLSGHSASEPNSTWVSALADWVHLTAGCLWVGGVIQLALCVWPAAPELRRSAFLRFSRLAPVLIALLVAAGVYLSILRLPELADLWEESYGHVLVLKLALVSLALAWGAFHHFVVGPALERSPTGNRLIPRSLIGESAVGMAILLAAAVLVNSEPPEPPGAPPAQAVTTAR